MAVACPEPAHSPERSKSDCSSARGEDNREMEAGRWKMEAIKRREMTEERREKKKKGCSTAPRNAGL